MKKYMTPELSELLFEDVLLNSDDDNLVPDPGNDGYDGEDALSPLIVD